MSDNTRIKVKETLNLPDSIKIDEVVQTLEKGWNAWFRDLRENDAQDRLYSHLDIMVRESIMQHYSAQVNAEKVKDFASQYLTSFGVDIAPELIEYVLETVKSSDAGLYQKLLQYSPEVYTDDLKSAVTRAVLTLFREKRYLHTLLTYGCIPFGFTKRVFIIAKSPEEALRLGCERYGTVKYEACCGEITPGAKIIGHQIF